MDTVAASRPNHLTRVWQTTRSLITSTRVSWIVIGFGAALRAASYLSNAGLYVDEGAIALNVMRRDFAGLLGKLDFNQAAPPAFLFLERLAVLVLGDSEYALRLFPFLFALAALILFYAVARFVLAGWAVPLALLFFAVSEQVIHFGAQVKQYSGDVFVTLLVLWMALRLQSRDLTATRLAPFAVVGAAVVWLSHPSVFVLAGVGSTLALLAIRNRDWRALARLLGCFAIWLCSFALLYSVSLRHLRTNDLLEASWMRKGTFMPLPPRSVEDLGWFVKTYFNIFSNPGDSPLPIAAGVAFGIGCAALFRKQKSHLSFLLSPIVFALVASGVHRYPFGRRLLLFIVPILLIVIVSGIEYVIENATPYSVVAALLILDVAVFEGLLPSAGLGRALLATAIVSAAAVALAMAMRASPRRKFGSALAGAAISLLLLLQPVGGATNATLHPPEGQDLRPVMAYTQQHIQPGDVIYVYHHQLESYLYYAPRYGLDSAESVIGTDARTDWKNDENEFYKRELDRLKGRTRVWVLFSHVRSQGGVNEERYMVKYLNTIGRELDRFKKGAASVYLFDLTGSDEVTR